jgi:hypothetical protein
MFSSIEASRLWDGSSARRCKLICFVSIVIQTRDCTYSLSIGVVHVSISLLDELLGVFQDLVKVVRRVDDLVVRDLNHGQILLDTLLKELLLYQL